MGTKMSSRKASCGQDHSVRITMQLKAFVPWRSTTYPLCGSRAYVVAPSRRCGGSALSAKRTSRDSGIFSSLGFSVSVLPPVLPVCARQLMQASSEIPSPNARFIVVSLYSPAPKGFGGASRTLGQERSQKENFVEGARLWCVLKKSQ